MAEVGDNRISGAPWATGVPSNVHFRRNDPALYHTSSPHQPYSNTSFQQHQQDWMTRDADSSSLPSWQETIWTHPLPFPVDGTIVGRNASSSLTTQVGRTTVPYPHGRTARYPEPGERIWTSHAFNQPITGRQMCEADSLVPHNVDRGFILAAVALLSQYAWTCPEPSCTRMYGTRSHLKRHILSVHSDTAPDLDIGRDLHKLISLLSSFWGQNDYTALPPPMRSPMHLDEISTTAQRKRLPVAPSHSTGTNPTQIALPSQEAIHSGTTSEERWRESGSEGTMGVVARQSAGTRRGSSDIDTASEVPAPKPPHPVGIATIRIEVLSIRPLTTNETEPDPDRDSSSDSSEDDGEMKDADAVAGDNGSSKSSTVRSSSGPGGSNSGTARRRRGDESSDQSRSQSSSNLRARKRNRTEGPGSEKPRLACPYQAFEPWMRCGTKGQGLRDLTRLRHHYKRQHVRGRRCLRCWASFDTDALRSAHEERANCREAEESRDERFMNPDQEVAIEQPHINVGCTETTWWNMFNLLLPDAGGRNIFRQSCSPYYVPPSNRYVLPPFVLPEYVSSTLPTQAPEAPRDYQNSRGRQSDAVDNVPQSMSGIFTMPQSANSGYVSDTLSVPVYSNTAGLGLPFTPPLDFASLNQEAASWTQDQTNTTTESSSNGSQTWAFIGGSGSPSETPSNRDVAEKPLAATASHNHYQQMYEQERSMNAQLQTINAELAQSNRANHEDIRNVVLSLDDIITGGNIPDLIGRLLAARARLVEVNSRLMRTR